MEQPSSSTSNTLSVHVVGHEKRKTMAEALAASVSADHLWMDHGYHGEWKNHLRAWKAAQESDATHAVVLQDDAVPIDDFRKHVLDAIEQKPYEMISLYVGTHRPHREQVETAVRTAELNKASWLYADTLMWGVGVVMPRLMIEGVFDIVRKSRLPYDQRLGLGAMMLKRPVYYTWPSLVDHADVPTVAHADKKQQGLRVAHRVGVPAWNSLAVEISTSNTSTAVASKRDIV